MTDYISRETAIEFVESIISTMSVCVSIDECNGMKSMQKRAISALRDVPAADVVEVVHGKWHLGADGMLHCSACDTIPTNRVEWNGMRIYDMTPIAEYMKFCPHCGARMDGDAE